MEKLDWCGYPMVKKIRRYVYSFWRDPGTWQTDGQTNRQTDGHRMTAISALMHSIARQKWDKCTWKRIRLTATQVRENCQAWKWFRRLAMCLCWRESLVARWRPTRDARWCHGGWMYAADTAGIRSYDLKIRGLHTTRLIVDGKIYALKT